MRKMMTVGWQDVHIARTTVQEFMESAHCTLEIIWPNLVFSTGFYSNFLEQYWEFPVYESPLHSWAASSNLLFFFLSIQTEFLLQHFMPIASCSVSRHPCLESSSVSSVTNFMDIKGLDLLWTFCSPVRINLFPSTFLHKSSATP